MKTSLRFLKGLRDELYLELGVWEGRCRQSTNYLVIRDRNLLLEIESLRKTPPSRLLLLVVAAVLTSRGVESLGNRDHASNQTLNDVYSLASRHCRR